MTVTNLGMPRVGFFTDTSVCIGCKACEVACKEWNAIPADGALDLTGESFDNTSHLGASEALAECRRVSGQLGLPCLDPVSMGVEAIVDNLLACCAN